jgi:hypothetical protein
MFPGCRALTDLTAIITLLVLCVTDSWYPESILETHPVLELCSISSSLSPSVPRFAACIYWQVHSNDDDDDDGDNNNNNNRNKLIFKGSQYHRPRYFTSNPMLGGFLLYVLLKSISELLSVLCLKVSIYGNITDVFCTKPHIMCRCSVKYALTQKIMVLALTYTVFITNTGDTSECGSSSSSSSCSCRHIPINWAVARLPIVHTSIWVARNLWSITLVCNLFRENDCNSKWNYITWIIYCKDVKVAGCHIIKSSVPTFAKRD